jgi:hypothetical protein
MASSSSPKRIREYVLNRELEAGLHMTDFVLTGVKLLAAAEVV